MLKAEGHSGELTCGGRLAIRLGHWTLETETGAIVTIQTEVRWTDLFWAGQTPLRLMLRLGADMKWRWPQATFEGSEITVFGPPENDA